MTVLMRRSRSVAGGYCARATRRMQCRGGPLRTFCGGGHDRATACAPEIDGGEIEIAKLDELELIEPDALQSGREGFRVADEHDRQPLRLEVLPRNALNVVGRDGVDALPVGLQVGERQLI